MTNKSLDELIKEANARIEAMSPEARGKMYKAQKKSWLLAEACFGSDKDEAEYAKAMVEKDETKLRELAKQATARMARAEELLKGML